MLTHFLALVQLMVSAVAPAIRQAQPDVRLAFVQQLPGGAAASISRTSGPIGRDIILLTDSSTTTDLAAALAVLREVRGRPGDAAGRQIMISIPPQPVRPLHPQASRALARYLDRLRVAPLDDIEGVGRVPSIVVPLSQLSRDTAGARHR